MRLHEYQAKQIFAESGIPTPESRVVTDTDEAVHAIQEVGYPAVIKAQVHVGGRGKAGGIKFATNHSDLRTTVTDILGMDIKGYTVEEVLIEAGVEVDTDMYVGITMDRSAGEPTMMVSTEGGVDIEAVADDTPKLIAKEHIDPAFGIYPYQTRKVAYKAGIPSDTVSDVSSVLLTLYTLYTEYDATDIEINPLMITESRDIVAADAVMNIDDDALFRQSELAAHEHQVAGDPLEAKADEYGFDYVRLDGNVGIIGNGAGLVMATLDLVDHYDGKPANFLDIGGGAKAERVANALDIVCADKNVDAIVFNIFGGITRGDEVAQGINDALSRVNTISKDIVVRLAGTNAQEGMEVLNTDIVSVESTLEAAVAQAVANAAEASQ